jgi:hypothetical protein
MCSYDGIALGEQCFFLENNHGIMKNIVNIAVILILL